MDLVGQLVSQSVICWVWLVGWFSLVWYIVQMKVSSFL